MFANSRFSGKSIFHGVIFAWLFGAFLVSYIGLAEAAKYAVPSVPSWIGVEFLVGSAQFTIAGILLGLAHRGFQRKEVSDEGELATWFVQGMDDIVVDSAPDRIWSLLEDSRRLHEWMPAVIETSGHLESQGSVRKCLVNFEGRSGQVVERCVLFEKPRRIGWLLTEDTIGFSKMLKNFTFNFVLEPVGPERTRIVHSSYFEPRNWFGRVMIALMIRNKFRSVRRRVLENIKRIAEKGEADGTRLDRTGLPLNNQ